MTSNSKRFFKVEFSFKKLYMLINFGSDSTLRIVGLKCEIHRV